MTQFELNLPLLEETCEKLTRNIENYSKIAQKVKTCSEALTALEWSGAASTMFAAMAQRWYTESEAFIEMLREFQRILCEQVKEEAAELNQMALNMPVILGGPGGAGSKNMVSYYEESHGTIDYCHRNLQEDYDKELQDLTMGMDLLGEMEYAGHIKRNLSYEHQRCVREIQRNQIDLNALQEELQAYGNRVRNLEEMVVTAMRQFEMPEGWTGMMIEIHRQFASFNQMKHGVLRRDWSQMEAFIEKCWDHLSEEEKAELLGQLEKALEGKAVNGVDDPRSLLKLLVLEEKGYIRIKDMEVRFGDALFSLETSADLKWVKENVFDYIPNLSEGEKLAVWTWLFSIANRKAQAGKDDVSELTDEEKIAAGYYGFYDPATKRMVYIKDPVEACKYASTEQRRLEILVQSQGWAVPEGMSLEDVYWVNISPMLDGIAAGLYSSYHVDWEYWYPLERHRDLYAKGVKGAPIAGAALAIGAIAGDAAKNAAHAANTIPKPKAISNPYEHWIDKGTSNTNQSAQNPMSGDEWNNYFQGKYGQGNVTWKPTALEDVIRDPQRLYGSTQSEVASMLGEGWTPGTYGSSGTGWKFINHDGMVFYHAGGGMHGGSYYGFSSGATGKVKIVGSDYIPLLGDKATVIYYNGGN